jgi:hypothetical protein
MRQDDRVRVRALPYGLSTSTNATRFVETGDFRHRKNVCRPFGAEDFVYSVLYRTLQENRTKPPSPGLIPFSSSHRKIEEPALFGFIEKSAGKLDC